MDSPSDATVRDFSPLTPVEGTSDTDSVAPPPKKSALSTREVNTLTAGSNFTLLAPVAAPSVL